MASYQLPENDLNFVSDFNLSNHSNFGSNDSYGIFSSSIAEQLLTKNEEVLEPTPIAQNGMVVVDTLPFEPASWNRSNSFLNSLRALLKEPSISIYHESNQSKKNEIFDSSNNENDYNKFHAKMGRRLSESAKSMGVVSLDSISDEEESTILSSLRSSHLEQWNQRYIELVEYQKEHGNCLVPLNWPSNPPLAHWVKRQRYLFRMKKEGRHSTLTNERQRALESLGFVWDSHAAGWEERWDELRQFKERYGHCNVPKKYPENQQLAIWVKCQRRQFKLFSGGLNSNMTLGRIDRLRALGFVFDPRSRKKTAYTL